VRLPWVACVVVAMAPGCAEWVPVPTAPRGPAQDLGRIRVHTAAQSLELDDAKIAGAFIEGRALGPVQLVEGVAVKDARNDVVSVRHDLLTRDVEQKTGRALRTGVAAGGAFLLTTSLVAGTLVLVFGAFGPVN